MTVRYDPSEAARLVDPYPYYAALRAEPVVPAGPGAWAVTRYADVAALLTDRRLSHDFPPAVYRISGEPDELTDFFRATVLNRDPPTHTRLRRAMARLLGPRTVAGLSPRIDKLVAELVDAIRGAGPADLVERLAFPLPVVVAAELLGVPAGDLDTVRPYALALNRAFAAGPSDGTTAAGRAAAAEAVVWLRGYVDRLIRSGVSDPVSQVFGSTGDDLSRAELVDNVIFMFFAGFDTTTNLLATGLAELLRRPALRAALRTDPDRASAVADEFLRWDAPVQSTARMTTEPVRVGDRTIRAGRMVVLLLGSANRDERRFAEPDEFRLERVRNPHLAFGAGPHFCLGAQLARIEAAAVFRHLAGEPAVEPAGPPERLRDGAFRGYRHVPATIR